MNWIVLAMALEVGWLPQGDFLMHDPPGISHLAGTFYVDMEARATAWGFLFVGGEVKTLMWKFEGDYSFCPERMLYGFNAGVKWGAVEVGFRHWCTHPISPYTAYQGLAKWEGGYEEVYLHLDTMPKR